MSIQTINDISIVVSGAEKHLEKNRPEIARAWLKTAKEALLIYVLLHHSALLIEKNGFVWVTPYKRVKEGWQYVPLYSRILVAYDKAVKQSKIPPLSDMRAYAQFMETRVPSLARIAYDVLSKTSDPAKQQEILVGVERAKANQDRQFYTASKRAAFLKCISSGR